MMSADDLRREIESLIEEIMCGERELLDKRLQLIAATSTLVRMETVEAEASDGSRSSRA